jgi:hypothetical protein
MNNFIVFRCFATGAVDRSSREEDKRLFIERTDVIVPDNLGIKLFSDNEFGYIVDWVNKVHGLCVNTHQQKNIVYVTLSSSFCCFLYA